MNNVWSVQGVIEAIDTDELMLYVGNGINMEEGADKRIILFSHELNRSGAPSVLLDMSKVLLELGYTVFVACEKDGELLEEFIERGVSVIVYEKMTSDAEWILKISEVFPDVLVNTMALFYVVNFLAIHGQRIYWWIHEPEYTIESFKERIKELPRVPSLKILSASPLIQRSIEKCWNMKSELLNFYIEDVPVVEIQKGNKLNLINVGDVNGNKGQDILIKAFDMLDDNTKAKCDLYFCGDNQKYNEQLLLQVLDYVDANENVHMLEGMPKSELYEVYDEVDIVVVASYYESTSAVAVEGLMKEKLCICTETCGVCEYLKDGESVFTFKRGDAVSLSEALNKAINQYHNLDGIRKSGRQVYEQVYTREVFKKNLEEILEGIIQINSKMNACTGCGACKEMCPVNAITMKANEKGFLYPAIDNEKCIRCKKCVVTCPVNEPTVNKATKTAYAFRRKDEVKKMESQSGGAFSVFAEAVLKDGGVVYGVALNTDGKAVYERVAGEQDLKRLKGSKYVQADLENAYLNVKEDLKNRKVLFVGTPCYVAGLKRYLNGENTEKLLTVDLICHGVPSPEVYKKHLEFLSTGCDEKITDFNFRDKYENGWHGCVETYTDISGAKRVDNVYANIFFSDAALRESCYSCQYACTERAGDITIGDFWGVDKVYSDMDDNKGISLVLVNSEKGNAFWNEITKSNEAEIRVTKMEKCLQHNLKMPTPRSKKTEDFWNDYFNSDYKKIIRKYGQPKFYERPNFSVLNCWQKKLESGNGLASILSKRGIQKILILGDKKNNQLAIMELKRGTIDVFGEICFSNRETSGLVPTFLIDDELKKIASDADTILITDECEMVEILENLHKVGIPMEKITPLSFVVDEEV